MRVRSPVARPLLAVALCLAALGGCAYPSRSGEFGLDPTLNQTTHVEEGSLLALAVSTRAARHRLGREYFPLQIGVVNKGLEHLTVTPEALTLVAPEGRRYPVAGGRELRDRYPSTDVDRNLGEIAPLFRHRYSSYRRVASNLTPGFDAPIARDTVAIPRFGYMVDFIYFPRPPGVELRGVPLELELKTRELDDPVFVRFMIGKPDER